MTKALRPLTIGLTLLAVGCAENGERGELSEGRSKVPVGERKVIKTTAYTDSASGHRSYGVKNAIGSRLQSGSMNSAAADWSRFPIGTKFRVVDNNQMYVIDDYGSCFGWHRYHRFVRTIAPTYGSMGLETRND
jgi:3D (Asp-Asp-Asp) domain-containing protein